MYYHLKNENFDLIWQCADMWDQCLKQSQWSKILTKWLCALAFFTFQPLDDFQFSVRLGSDEMFYHLLFHSWSQCPLCHCPRSFSQVQAAQLPPAKGDLLSVGRGGGCKSLALLSRISAVPDDQYGTSTVIQDGFTSHIHQLASCKGHCC